MSTLGQLAVAASSFAIVAAVALWKPRALRSASPLVVALAVAAAVGGSLAADGAATDLPVYDGVLRVVAGVAFVAAGCYCPARARFAGAAIVTAASLLGSGDAWPGAVALGIGLATLVVGTDGHALGAIAGLAIGQAALRLDWPSTTGSSLLIGLGAFCVLAIPAFSQIHQRSRRRLVVAGAAVVGGLVIAGGLWGVTLLAVREDLSRAVDVANAGLDAARAGDTETAADRFDEAGQLFRRSSGRLDSWWAQPIRLVPAAAQNARALRVMSGAGQELSAAGAATARSADPDEIKPANGVVPLDEVRSLGGPLRDAELALATAQADLGRIGSPWLVGMLQAKLDTLDEKVARGRRDTATARIAVDVVPRLLGGEGERRYLVTFQNPAELRANGGIIGNFAEVSYANGDITLVRNARDSDFNEANPGVLRTLPGPEDYVRRYERYNPHHVIQNVTLSPDFPSVAEVLEGVYPQAGGREVDGVISLDPIALAEFLRLTGNVVVPGFDVDLTPDNAAEILLREQYVRYPDNDTRVAFLDATVRAVFERLQTTELPGPSRIGEVLGPMARQGRLQIHSVRDDEQAFFRRIGADRAFPAVRGGDFFGLVTQNGGGSKIDVFQQRTVRYEARVDPATGGVEAAATVRVRNDAPASGLPDYVIGSFPDNPLPRGTSRILLSVYSPHELSSASIDGRPVQLLEDEELGRNVFTAQLDIPPGGTQELVLRLAGAVDLAANRGRYRLRVWRQATVEPDRTRIRVEAAPGWSVEPVVGLRTTPDGAGRRLTQAEDLTVVAGFVGT